MSTETEPATTTLTVGSVDPLTVMTSGREPPAGCDQWAMRTVRADFTSQHNYRYPFPGSWAEAPGPIQRHNNECPRAVGDGICAATTYSGMSSGHIPARTILLVAYADKDVLGGSREGKLRLRRMFVVDVIDGERFLADLRSANLRYANLRSANLRSANLRSADLRYANLEYANLRYANLRSANLEYANLRYANLRSANLRSADLTGAYNGQLALWDSNFDWRAAGVKP